MPVGRDLLGLLGDGITEIADILLHEVIGAREDTIHTLDLRPGVLPERSGLVQQISPDVVREVRDDGSEHDALELAEAEEQVLLHAAAHLVADITVAVTNTLHLIITIHHTGCETLPNLQSVTEAHFLVSLVTTSHAVVHLVNEDLVLFMRPHSHAYEEVVFFLLLFNSHQIAGDDGADELFLGGERKNSSVGGGDSEVGIIQTTFKSAF